MGHSPTFGRFSKQYSPTFGKFKKKNYYPTFDFMMGRLFWLIFTTTIFTYLALDYLEGLFTRRHEFVEMCSWASIFRLSRILFKNCTRKTSTFFSWCNPRPPFRACIRQRMRQTQIVGLGIYLRVFFLKNCLKSKKRFKM